MVVSTGGLEPENSGVMVVSTAIQTHLVYRKVKYKANKTTRAMRLLFLKVRSGGCRKSVHCDDTYVTYSVLPVPKEVKKKYKVRTLFSKARGSPHYRYPYTKKHEVSHSRARPQDRKIIFSQIIFGKIFSPKNFLHNNQQIRFELPG